MIEIEDIALRGRIEEATSQQPLFRWLWRWDFEEKVM